jgi:hemolysin activation/secretion protein
MSSWRNSSPLHQNLQQQQQQQQHYSPMMQQQQQHQLNNNDSSSTSPLENGPRAKCDQVVFEAIAKAAEIVVGSRCWIDHIPPAVGGPSSSSRRFNLLVPEVQGVRYVQYKN